MTKVDKIVNSQKVVQCTYCKSDNIRYPWVEFNLPQELIEGSNRWSACGCSICSNTKK